MAGSTNNTIWRYTISIIMDVPSASACVYECVPLDQKIYAKRVTIVKRGSHDKE